jgi:hypothetical protein
MSTSTALNTGLTAQQVAWAKSHDWFSWSTEWYPDCHVVTVLESGTQRQADGSVTPYSTIKQFANFKALRDWAGY